MTTFTPYASLFGGVLIGLSAVILMLTEGRIAGITGIVGRLIPPWRGQVGGRAAFIAGLILAPLVYLFAGSPLPEIHALGGPALLVPAGLLVGIGTVLGNGCTSGHGVCGMARLSPRSIVATLTFMAVAFLTVYVFKLIG